MSIRLIIPTFEQSPHQDDGWEALRTGKGRMANFHRLIAGKNIEAVVYDKRNDFIEPAQIRNNPGTADLYSYAQPLNNAGINWRQIEPTFQMVPLPNHGGSAFTFLYHIYANYDNLRNVEVMLKTSPQIHAMNVPQLLADCQRYPFLEGRDNDGGRGGRVWLCVKNETLRNIVFKDPWWREHIRAQGGSGPKDEWGHRPADLDNPDQHSWFFPHIMYTEAGISWKDKFWWLPEGEEIEVLTSEKMLMIEAMPGKCIPAHNLVKEIWPDWEDPAAMWRWVEGVFTVKKEVIQYHPRSFYKKLLDEFHPSRTSGGDPSIAEGGAGTSYLNARGSTRMYHDEWAYFWGYFFQVTAEQMRLKVPRSE